MNRQRGQIVQAQELKQVQRLILSPQMQQSLHLLQLPVMELSTVIANELEQNPLLEYAEGGEELIPFRDSVGGKSSREEESLKDFIENSLADQLSLFDFLMQQAKEAFKKTEEFHLAEAIIGNLDANGFLTTSLEEIAALYESDVKALFPILQIIQLFEPAGIGARDLRESFLLQLKARGKEKSLAFTIISKHYLDMVQNRIPFIARSLKQPISEVKKAIETDISQLDLHPGANLPQGHYPLMVSPIVPDIYVVNKEGELLVEINERHIPSFRFNPHYLSMLENAALSNEEKSYLEEKMAAGRSLLRNIHERHQTLFRVTQQLLVFQRDFFLSEKGALLPLTMKEVAESVGLHESTIVRAVANKYLSCSKGIFPFRSFFTHAYINEEGEAVSSNSVKAMLRDIIENEDRSSPLSDEAISSLITAKGIPCARRTIVKYRHELGIGNAGQRKSY